MPKPRMITEKAHDFKGSMIRLFKSLNNFKYMIYIAIILGMISAILALIAPNKLSKLTDEIALGIKININDETIKYILEDKNISQTDKQIFNEYLSQDANAIIENIQTLPKSIQNIINPKINMQKVKNIVIFLSCLYIISALLNYIQTLILNIVSNKYAKKLRTKIYQKINKLPLKYFDTHITGDILSRITNDVDTITHNLSGSLAQIVSSLTLLIGSLIMMFYTNWIMSITAILSSIIGFGLMKIILSSSQKYFVKKQEELGKLNGYIEEIYSSHNVVKAYNGIKDASETFKKLNNNLYECNRKSQFLSGLMHPLMGFIGNLGYVAVCIVGAVLTINNIISFGVIIAFIIYVRLFNNPLSQIAQTIASFQSTVAASERAFEFLDEKELENESHLNEYLSKENVSGKIEFKNVNFSYDKDKQIIKNFNLLVKPGQKIAIVGPTGAGKTTLVNLLMKFYEINSGEILIDDVNINELTRENIHDLFIMVLQDTWLFNGTIRENIKFNKKDITDNEIINACEIVGVNHFINTLPGGLDYHIEDNNLISSGQKQLLTIARGMIENAPFLILDEATSNVDTRTEEIVQKAMDKLMEKRTSFIIAHRLSTIKNADLILVLNEGKLVEQGTHKELLDKKGFYHELYNSQFDLLNN